VVAIVTVAGDVAVTATDSDNDDEVAVAVAWDVDGVKRTVVVWGVRSVRVRGRSKGRGVK
jgi:hypothetical protein